MLISQEEKLLGLGIKKSKVQTFLPTLSANCSCLMSAVKEIMVPKEECFCLSQKK